VFVFYPQTLLDRLFEFAWIAWFASWMIAAVWRSRAVDRPSIGAQLPYRLLNVVGALLLLGAWPRHTARVWEVERPVGWLLFAFCVAGFLFTWWARIHLGRLWSGTVTRKADHRVVDSGPYRIVRHPIYSGLSLAAFATAFYIGRPWSVAGAAILTFSFYIKARLEERFLRQELGGDYALYARRVRMLIPFVFALLASCAHTPKLPAQNPSPMVDFTRAHERLVKTTIEGEQFTAAGAEVLITPRAAAAHEGDLLIHFHGAAWLPFEAAIMTDRPLVVAVVNVGQGGGAYDAAYSDPAAFDRLVSGIRSHINIDRVFLSGFSAGYGAVRAILRNRAEAISGVLLLDGLHTDYIPPRTPIFEGGRLDTTKLQPFLDFAKSGKRFVFSHSEIFPGTFASTTETADWLIAQLGMQRTPVLKWGPHGMQQLSEAKSGNVLIMGFAGNTAPDHVDQFHAMPEFLQGLFGSDLKS